MSDDLLHSLSDTLRNVASAGKATCRLCGRVVYGSSFGEILEALAKHGERSHKGHPTFECGIDPRNVE